MRLVHRLAVACLMACFSLGGFVATASSNKVPSADPILGLETVALKDQAAKNPFVAKDDVYHLSFARTAKIDFPKTLDGKTPIVLHTRYGTAKQFIVSQDSYRAELKGRYLIYRGSKNSILYRYDADQKSLREFVYLKDSRALPANGEVIEWRFEGAELYALPDGSVALAKTVDIKNEVRKVSNNAMAERIQGFLAKRQGTPLKNIPVIKTLFIIPKPEYIDGNRKTQTEGIRYQVANNQLTLHLENSESLVYPLWVDPTFRFNTDADVIINGPSGSGYGISVDSAGDFNGDGIDDVIIGDAKDNTRGTDSGRAFIFFGQNSSNQSVLSADPDADVIFNTSAEDDLFGKTVSSAGDFNGDGLGDVIVGAPEYGIRFPPFSAGNEGRAYIFYGRSTGDQLVLAADVIITGGDDTDFFGESVASAGDFNGDGFGDVIVGATGTGSNGNFFNGSAHIIFGRNSTSQLFLSANSGSDLILNGNDNGDEYGLSVASAGDFNGDGLDDVIVGAYLDDNNGLSNSGSAFIFFGQNPGSQLILRADTDADIILDGQDANDGFGFSVASAGDFNGDGFDDAIVGAYRDDNNGLTDSGSAFIFFGQNSTSQLLLRADVDADVILEGQRENGSLGAQVTAGDLNGDEFSDVMVTAAIGTFSSGSSGSVFIFYGQNPADQLILGADVDADVIIGGPATFFSFFGESVASAGNFNGAGFDDIIIGGPDNAFIFFSPFDPPKVVHNDFNGDSTSDLLIYNTTLGHIGVGLLDAGMVQSGGLVLTADPALGWTVSGTGDFDGNRTADLLLFNTTTGELRMVLLDGSTIVSDTIVAVLPAGFGLQTQGIGDIDGDGKSDILLFKADNGFVAGVLMDGATITTAAPVFTVDVGNDWTLLNTGDFDGDGNADLFLYNTVDGSMSYVPLDGVNTPGAQVGLFALDPAIGWVVEDVGDFNADGKADLLVHETTSGTLAVVLLDGAGGILSAAQVFTVDVANNWTVVNAGDYDGDGKLDVLLFNTVSGDTETLLLDGTTPLGVQSITQLDAAGGWIVHSGKPSGSLLPVL